MIPQTHKFCRLDNKDLGEKLLMLAERFLNPLKFIGRNLLNYV
jgi:hypothetical protein